MADQNMSLMGKPQLVAVASGTASHNFTMTQTVGRCPLGTKWPPSVVCSAKKTYYRHLNINYFNIFSMFVV